MAPKKNARDITPTAAATTQASAAAPASASQPKPKKSGDSWDKVLQNIYDHYIQDTPQRTKLIDVFLVFLVAVGALQFLYCVLAGNYPFNAFLSGFSATVGQFVLTVSLRVQTSQSNKTEFPSVSPERAFADYVVCSLILHFFCVNFIN
ncbi:oligosaccharyltransferase complex subunit epsilon [Fusarium falciforme]|uniref:Dolichyl-diphosphooligosaccharide--protein glycosyltransferase subunit OST2 n=1 Tax=Fusarium falciforme TaxID=195108 RepID=A0A9W8RJZ2_9HYPO|nr:oligosaccharyltransferase complex subunit epsilon [Fusarium falciforme]KAJ4209086.1 oligosaccharyltransferase complex subunit epsilon [Fusarium falciforme]